MYCFKRRVILPNIIFSFSSSITITSSVSQFFSFFANKAPREISLKSFKFMRVKDIDYFFVVKPIVKIVDFPLFSFSNSFVLLNSEDDNVFSKFDSYFLKNNKKIIVDTFNSYFYYFYPLKTEKSSLLLGRFLTFLINENVNSLQSFEEKFRLFKGA